MSAKTIKAWQGAAAASGGTAEGMTASLKGLSRSMNDFVIMGDTSMLPYFNALGVSMVDSYGKVRNLDDVMLDLSDSLSRMDRKQAYSIGAAMGLDEGTLNTLLQGRDAMQEMLDIQNSMYHSSEKELEASRELSKQQAILSAHWESLKTMIANALIPILLKLTKVVNEWMTSIQRNERAVRHVFEVLAFIIGMILIPLFSKALIAALAFIAPFAPFILVVAALSAAFILLYDDYKTWAEGGNSLFDWSWFQKMIDGSTFSVKGLKDAFKELAQDVVNFVMPSLRDALDVISKIKSGDFKGALASLTSLYMRPVEAIADAGHWAVEKAANGVDAVAGVDKNDPASISAKVKSDKRVGSKLGDKVRDAVGYDGAGSSSSPKNVNVGKSPVKLKGNFKGFGADVDGYIRESAAKYGIDEKVLRGFVKMEAGWTGKMSPTGAIGTGQFTQGTWNGLAKTSEGKAIGMTPINKSNFRKSNDPRYNKRINTLATGLLAKQNAALLRKAGLPVTGENLYMLHNIGPGVIPALKGSSNVSQATITAMRHNGMRGGESANAFARRQRNIFNGHYAQANAGYEPNTGVSNGAKNAGEMINRNQAMQQKPNTTNNNQKYIDVKIDRVNVQSSSSTISGTTGDALKGVASNVSQLVSGMS